ncbi:hypothetical protein ILUMI_26427 [Ignelater luminosus]|uniref:Uncharacterized protein n=1 Tax=Ignelater luminosus TaxID=2038154 RepID=A0A8K0C6N0_IGNLU|nr:hypothetical protein ILUMI_26427 [Ignelater luminosus]
MRSEDLKPKVYRLPEKFLRHPDTHQSGHWYAGKVKGKGPQPRSYQVRDHRGNLFRRNRMMINPSPHQSCPTPTTPPANSTP